MPSASVFGFSRHQLKMLEVIILLNAMALSLVLPSVTSTGEPLACTIPNRLCLPINSDFSNSVRNDGNSSMTLQIASTQTSEAVILFVFDLPFAHVTSITDSQLDSYTFQILTRTVVASMEEEIWTGFLKNPTTTIITVNLNQSSVIFQTIALDYQNVASFASPTGQQIDTVTVNFLKTFDNVTQTNAFSTESGAWIVGASAIECGGCGSRTMTVSSGFLPRASVPLGDFNAVAADTNSSIISPSELTFQVSFSGVVNNIGMTQTTILALPKFNGVLIPINPCDGLLRASGRCFYGTNGCTVPQGSSSCSTVVSFPQPFTAQEFIYTFVSGSPLTGSYQYLTFNGEFTANQTNWAIPVSQTELLNDATHRLFLRQGMGLNWVSTKQLGSFFIQVITAAPVGSNIILQCAPSLAPASTAWVNVTNPISISTTGIKLSTFNANAGVFPTACGISAIQFTSLRIIGYGGDGSTVAQFGRIQLETSEALPIVATCGYSSVSFTSFTLSIGISDLSSTGSTVNCGWKAEGLAG